MRRKYHINNPYGRQGKGGYVISSFMVPTMGILLLCVGFTGWGAALLVLGIFHCVFAIWFAYGRK